MYGRKVLVAGPYPDANLDPVLQSRTGSFDYVLIQFYNNNCGYSGNDNAVIASYKQWTGTCTNFHSCPPFSSVYEDQLDELVIST